MKSIYSQILHINFTNLDVLWLDHFSKIRETMLDLWLSRQQPPRLLPSLLKKVEELYLD